MPIEDDLKPKDPVSENMDTLNEKPLKAFIYQDHAAHITVHMSMLQDPVTMQILQQNPKAQQIAANMMAHIMEHFGFQYRKNIEEKLGVPYPAPDEEMSEDMEVEISRLAAAASQKLLQSNQAMMAQQQAQQAAQDPVVQMQQQELQIKMAEVQRKAQKDQADVQLRNQQQQIEQQRISTQAEIEGAKLGAQIAKDKTQQDFDAATRAVDEQIKGVELGLKMGEKMAQQLKGE